MKTLEQLQAMIDDWAQQLPLLAARLERPALIAAGHRHYEAIMCLTPVALQDEIYETLHLLMYRHGLCARPRWSQGHLAGQAQSTPRGNPVLSRRR